ncbi:MAG: sugar ABC transporter permease [Gammaproteobacteria bacterium]|nr:MAG: sugar ABC transporter permease [Gammaproteobacteria bacterium]
MIKPLQMNEAKIGAAIAIGFLLFNAIFWLYPFVWLAIMAVSEWRFFDAPVFSGLTNLNYVLQDPEFWNSFWNVVRFMAYFIPIVLISSLAFAFGLQHLGRGKVFVALCFLLAYISSGVAYSLVFTKVFSETGPINLFLLDWLGYTIPWLSSPTMAMFSVSLVITWKFVGYFGLIFYSGLNAIPKEIYDAAKLDNCSAFTTLFKVTLPMINAQLIMVLIFAITVAFSIFTEPYMMTGGGPMESTNMPQLVMYETAFKRLQPGRAALMAIILAGVSYLVVRVVRKLFERDLEIV